MVCGLNFFDFTLMDFARLFLGFLFEGDRETNFERVLALPLLGSLNLSKKFCFHLGDAFFSSEI